MTAPHYLPHTRTKTIKFPNAGAAAKHVAKEIDKLVRAGTIDIDVGLSYATNAGNLRLELADFVESAANAAEAELAKN